MKRIHPEWLINNNGLIRLSQHYKFLEDNRLFICVLEKKQRFMNEPVAKILGLE
jgi:hypothetical protein